VTYGTTVKTWDTEPKDPAYGDVINIQLVYDYETHTWRAEIWPLNDQSVAAEPALRKMLDTVNKTVRPIFHTIKGPTK
jgi:hypothetical protein